MPTEPTQISLLSPEEPPTTLQHLLNGDQNHPMRIVAPISGSIRSLVGAHISLMRIKGQGNHLTRFFPVFVNLGFDDVDTLRYIVRDLTPDVFLGQPLTIITPEYPWPFKIPIMKRRMLIALIKDPHHRKLREAELEAEELEIASDMIPFIESIAQRLEGMIELPVGDHWSPPRYSYLVRAYLLSGLAPNPTNPYCAKQIKFDNIHKYARNLNKKIEPYITISGRRGPKNGNWRIQYPTVEYHQVTNSWIWSPTMEMTDSDVFDYCAHYNLPIHPAYKANSNARIGCSPCIFSSRDALRDTPPSRVKFLGELESARLEVRMRLSRHSQHLDQNPVLTPFLSDLRDEAMRPRSSVYSGPGVGELLTNNARAKERAWLDEVRTSKRTLSRERTPLYLCDIEPEFLE